MGWQVINAKVSQFNGGGRDSWGYLVGDGAEEGFFCFPQTPFFDHAIISDSFTPHLKFSNGGAEYDVCGISYAGNAVYGTAPEIDGYGSYVFCPRSTHGSWILLESLREPYYYTDIDETTKVGDLYYQGGFPDVNGPTETWELAGAVNGDESQPSAISATFIQNVWNWHDNGSTSQSRSGLCGRYYNEQDGTWKFVGIPSYTVTNGGDGCYFTNEVFTRSATRDRYRNLVYVGDRGHTITKDRSSGKWVIGTRNRGTWSESDSAPSMNGNVAFTGFRWNADEQTAEPDEAGNFELKWDTNRMGDEQREVLFGEVSLWRPRDL